MKNTKKILAVILSAIIVSTFGVFAMSSGESSDEKTNNGGTGTVEKGEELGKYSVEIMSCRLAKEYDGSDVVIVKYKFTNNNDEATAFYVAFDDNVFQDGVGLNEAYMLADNANYSSDNQMKEIKKGASLEVEVAYKLNDKTTPIEVEVEELFSFSDDKVTKTFNLQ